MLVLDWCRGVVSSGRDAPLRDLVAKLPVKKFSDEQIVDYLADLRDRFHRWLHQDEFGPNRKQQTASLRVLMKSFRALQRQLINGSSLARNSLMRCCEVGMTRRVTCRRQFMSWPLMSALSCRLLERLNGLPDGPHGYRIALYTLMAQLQTLDTNTDGKIFLTAARRKFDLSQATGRDLALADAERWLNNYLYVLVDTLSELNGRRGAERASFT